MGQRHALLIRDAANCAPPIKIVSDLLSNQSRKLAFAPRRLAVRMANPGEAKSPLICSAEKEGRDKPRMSGSVFENRKLLPVRGLPGWGGRDRTSECWNQNPVPYHLATPHQAGLL